MSFVFWLIGAAIFGTAGYFVGKRKNRMGLGVTLGILLQLIGLIIILCVPAKQDA